MTSDIWTLEMIARESAAPHNLPSLKLVNLYTFKQVRSAFMCAAFRENDRLLIIYICVQYIILLNRRATFHRINAGIVECVQGVTVMSLVKSFQQVNIIFTGTFMYLIGTFRDLFLGLFFLASYCHYWRCH